ncbi:MAG: hypothetical protein ACP5T1_04885 [Thermoplasmata archaeon]
MLKAYNIEMRYCTYTYLYYNLDILKIKSFIHRWSKSTEKCPKKVLMSREMALKLCLPTYIISPISRAISYIMIITIPWKHVFSKTINSIIKGNVIFSLPQNFSYLQEVGD